MLVLCIIIGAKMGTAEILAGESSAPLWKESKIWVTISQCLQLAYLSFSELIITFLRLPVPSIELFGILFSQHFDSFLTALLYRFFLSRSQACPESLSF